MTLQILWFLLRLLSNSSLTTLELNKFMLTSKAFTLSSMSPCALCGIVTLLFCRLGQIQLGPTSVQTLQLVEQQLIQIQARYKLTLQLFSILNSPPLAGTPTLGQSIHLLCLIFQWSPMNFKFKYVQLAWLTLPNWMHSISMRLTVFSLRLCSINLLQLIIYLALAVLIQQEWTFSFPQLILWLLLVLFQLLSTPEHTIKFRSSPLWRLQKLPTSLR